MKVLIAGAGGPLGRNLLKRYLARNDHVTALVLKRAELQGLEHPGLRVVEADVTRAESIRGVFTGIDMVISCIGITRIRGRLTHEAVDYQGNLNLLRDAEQAGVEVFGFISPAGTGPDAAHVPLLNAKHKFEEALRASKVSWVIFRSGGFFSDLANLKTMAAKGPLFVIGHGKHASTPIHVEDLADLMVADMDKKRNVVVELGGPEHLSWNDICKICFDVQNKPSRILKIPVWLCELTLALIRPFSARHHAMGRLLVHMSTREVCAPKRGGIRLRDYLASVK